MMRTSFFVRHATLLVVFAALAPALSGRAMAGGIIGQRIQCIFTDPIEAGNYYQGTDSKPTFIDNTGSANYFMGGNAAYWGFVSNFLDADASIISLTGATVTATDRRIKIASLTFRPNSYATSSGLIFGASMFFFVTDSSGHRDPIGTYNLGISNRINNVQGYSSIQLQNAGARPNELLRLSARNRGFGTNDYVPWVTADLYGSIHGDPELTLTDFELVEGPGFVGEVPEPSSLALGGIAALAGTFVAFRRRSSRLGAGE